MDKYSNVHDSVDWEEGSYGLVIHKSGKTEICEESKLQQVLDWKRKNDANAMKQEVQIFHFGDTISFHARSDRNKSDTV